MVATQEIHPEDRELIEKLAKLQDAHNQIHDLRGLLPESLLKPTRLAIEDPKGNGPAKLSGFLMVAAADGIAEISRFKKNFRGEQMQDLWQKTNSASFPQGRDAWTKDYIGLVRANQQSDTVDKKEIGSVKAEPVEENEDVQAVISAFKEAHPSIKVHSSLENAILPINVLVNGMAFQVTQEDSESRKDYHVSKQPGKKNSDLTTSVLQYINDSGAQPSLASLLSMLASYQDLQSRHCDGCHDIFDSDLAYPIIRKRKSTATKDSKAIEWFAYHEGCTV